MLHQRMSRAQQQALIPHHQTYRAQPPPPPRIQRPQRCTIIVLFLKQTEYSRKKSTWNWATEWYTGHEEVHCELFFAHTGQTCRVTSDCPVELVTGRSYRPQVCACLQYSDLTFRAQDWLAFEVQVSAGQLRSAYDFCLGQVGKPFDRKARNLFCFSEVFCCGNVSLCSDGSTPASDGHPSAWICSRLACCTLKQAGLLTHLDEWSCTPGQLRELLQHWAEHSEIPASGLSRAIGQPRVRQISLG